MEKKIYVCGECGCVFEGKNIIVNLKERLGKESFKSLLHNPLKRLFGKIVAYVCPECGSENVMEVGEKMETELPEYMTSGWDSSLLEEYFDIDAKSAAHSQEKPESQESEIS